MRKLYLISKWNLIRSRAGFGFAPDLLCVVWIREERMHDDITKPVGRTEGMAVLHIKVCD